MLLDDRLAQIVPTLTPAQIQFALRFASGPERRFAPDEKLLDVGDRDMAVWLVVEGSIVASRRDGLGREGISARDRTGARPIRSIYLIFELCSSAAQISAN
jgi:thioredoxin reductase (NADPH)